MKIAFFALLALFMVGFTEAMSDVIVIDDFEEGLRSEWEEKIFDRRTVYTVVTDNNNRVLKAESISSASGLIFRIDYDVQEYPVLTWRWKVENILERGDETSKDGDDYAARVYVIFPHWFPPMTRTINYIWANKLPRGEHVPNPYFHNAVMVAVRSGEEGVGDWHTERRNVLEDYRMIFGGDPANAGAVAIMTDTDNTGESATAFYDEIRLEKSRSDER